MGTVIRANDLVKWGPGGAWRSWAMGKMAREGHQTKKGSITLKHLGLSSFFFFFFFLSWAALSLRRVKRTEGCKEEGRQIVSLLQRWMVAGGMEGWRGEHWGRKEAGESGVKGEEWSEEGGEATFLSGWKYDDDLSKQQSWFDLFNAFIKQKSNGCFSPHIPLWAAGCKPLCWEAEQRTTAEFR